METFGITTFVSPEDDAAVNDYNLATATGGMTNGIKPLEMAAAFNVFNNGGIYNEPYFINTITTTSGDSVFDKSQMGLDTHRVMSEDTASTMWSILRQVVTSGTGGNAAQSLPTAGKTGTTDNAECLWFSGMTSNVTTSVWLGSREYDPTGLSSSVTAGEYGYYMSTLINNGVVTEDTATDAGVATISNSSSSSSSSNSSSTESNATTTQDTTTQQQPSTTVETPPDNTTTPPAAEETPETPTTPTEPTTPETPEDGGTDNGGGETT